MAKAINWPAEFRETVMAEPTDRLYAAVRLGRLYYDNTYWTPEEVVDIRVGNLVVRRGVVKGDLWCGPIRHLSPLVYPMLKPGLTDADRLMDFLRRNYNQSVGPDTEVTVVFYQNAAFDPTLVEVPPKR